MNKMEKSKQDKYVDESGRVYRIGHKACCAGLGRIAQNMHVIYDDGTKAVIPDTVHDKHRKLKPNEQSEQIYRKCLEAQCEDCAETSATTASCKYGRRLVGRSHHSPMATGRGQDCHYHRPPIQGMASELRTITQEEFLAVVNEDNKAMYYPDLVLAQSSPLVTTPSPKDIENALNFLDNQKKTPIPSQSEHFGVCPHH